MRANSFSLRERWYTSNHKCNGWPVLMLVALLLSFLLAPPAVAAEKNDGPVQIEAEVGWQGWGASGRHAPAVVTLKNTGDKDLNGVVEALNYQRYTPPPQPGSPSGKVLPSRDIPGAGYGERISLPAGGEKKVTLWFPVNGPGSRVDFVFREGDHELARMSTKMSGTAISGLSPLAVGVLGQAPPALERVRPMMPDGVYRAPQVKELTADLCPRRGEQLDAFGTILVTAAGVTSLDEAQRQALAGWAEMGGQLVISGGLDIEGSLAALPENTLDISVSKIEEQSGWQAEAAWLGTASPRAASASAARLSGAGEPWGPADHTLGLRMHLGTGTVTVLKFDPNQPPWRAGALGDALWSKFLTPENEEAYYSSMPVNYQLGNLINQTNNLSREVLPGWRPVGLYLLVFMVVAGPGTYLALRRLQRPEYTWVAVPLIALLFAGVVYAYMIKTGGNVLVNIVQVVDGRETSKTAGYTAMGYFAPTHGDFTAVLDDPDTTVQVQAMGGRPIEMMDESDGPPYRVIRGSNLEVHFGDQSQWNMRSISFCNDGLAEKADGLASTVKVQGNSIRGLVRNGTDMRLDHVTFIWGSQYKVLGDLKPGEEKTVDIEIAVPKYNPQGSYDSEYPTMWKIFQYPDGPPASPKRGAPPSPVPNRQLTVEEQRRADLAEGWTEFMRRLGPVESGWPLTLLAWSASPTGEVGIKQFHRSPSYLTMWVERPEIKLTGDGFNIPAGLVIPELTDFHVRDTYSQNNLTGFEGGYMVFAFQPQFGAGVKVNQVTVGLDYFAAHSSPGGGIGPPGPNPSPVPQGVLEVYHPAQGRWVGLAGARTFSLNGNYATVTGEVRLRITGSNPSQGTGFYFLLPTVAYGGENQ